MIYKSSGYKFYKNTIMFLSNNSYNPVNVVSPLTNATIRMISKYTSTQNEYDGVLGRDTLTRMFPFRYRFSGYEAAINLDGSTIIVPAVHFSDCDNLILPKGSPLIIPSTKLVKWQIVARPYLEAEIVIQDNIDNSSAIVSQVPPPLAARPPPPPPPPSTVSITRSIYPPHIKQLIIADSISKNESCVITGDSINQENACITTCGHVFTNSGLTTWLSVSSNQSCPLCRQKCSLA
jgi:hypothetical protein